MINEQPRRPSAISVAISYLLSHLLARQILSLLLAKTPPASNSSHHPVIHPLPFWSYLSHQIEPVLGKSATLLLRSLQFRCWFPQKMFKLPTLVRDPCCIVLLDSSFCTAHLTYLSLWIFLCSQDTFNAPSQLKVFALAAPAAR